MSDALRNRLIAERQAAATDEAIATAVARVEHYNRQWDAGKRSEADLTCPDNRIPDPADLGAWLPKCPAGAMSEFDTLSLPDHIWGIPLDQARARFEWDFSKGAVMTISHVPFLPPDPANLRCVSVSDDGSMREQPVSADADTRWLDATGAEITTTLSIPLTKTHSAWRDIPEAYRRRHPLAPLVDAWQRGAPLLAKAVDTDAMPKVILSRSMAVVEQTAPKYYLSRFNGAAHRNVDGHLMVGFEHPDMSGPTLPATVWTLQLAEAEKRGRGLTAALRTFIAAIVHVPLTARRVTNARSIRRWYSKHPKADR